MDYSPVEPVGKKRDKNNRNVLMMTCGVLTAVFICIIAIIGLTLGIISIVFGTMKSSDVYQQAVEAAQTNPDVITALGEPIEPKWWVSGSVSLNNDSGTADLSIPLQGTHNSGTLHAAADKSGGVWQFYRLEVTVDGRSDTIYLLPEIGR